MSTNAPSAPSFAPPVPLDAPVLLRLSKPQLAVVDRYAEARGLSRAAFIRDAIGHYVATSPTPPDTPAQVSAPVELPASPFAQGIHGAAFGSVAA